MHPCRKPWLADGSKKEILRPAFSSPHSISAAQNDNLVRFLKQDTWSDRVCHSEIADEIRSRRFYLKNLLLRTACKPRLWQRRNFFCSLSFSKPKLAKGSEKEILRLGSAPSFSIPAAQNDNFVRCVCFFLFGGTKAPPYGITLHSSLCILHS